MPIANWYEGVPGYIDIGDLGLTFDDEIRAAILDCLFSGTESPDGWQYVASFTSSGETECWWCGAAAGDGTGNEQDRHACKLCEGDGVIYRLARGAHGPPPRYGVRVSEALKVRAAAASGDLLEGRAGEDELRRGSRRVAGGRRSGEVEGGDDVGVVADAVEQARVGEVGEGRGFEIKRTTAPRTTRPMRAAVESLRPDGLEGIHAGEETHPLADGIRAVAFDRSARDVAPL